MDTNGDKCAMCGQPVDAECACEVRVMSDNKLREAAERVVATRVRECRRTSYEEDIAYHTALNDLEAALAATAGAPRTQRMNVHDRLDELFPFFDDFVAFYERTKQSTADAPPDNELELIGWAGGIAWRWLKENPGVLPSDVSQAIAALSGRALDAKLPPPSDTTPEKCPNCDLRIIPRYVGTKLQCEACDYLWETV